MNTSVSEYLSQPSSLLVGQSASQSVVSEIEGMEGKRANIEEEMKRQLFVLFLDVEIPYA